MQRECAYEEKSREMKFNSEKCKIDSPLKHYSFCPEGAATVIIDFVENCVASMPSHSLSDCDEEGLGVSGTS